MNTLLQEAITATRAGNKKEAQLLLAQNLKADPDNVQSWYLLSMLVDSPEKQAVYLSKALTLDPTHEKVQARLATLQTAPTITISDEPLDFLSQSKGNTLPDWLADDAASLQLDKVGTLDSEPEIEGEETVAAESDQVMAPEETVPDADENVPDWLRGNVTDAWVTEEPPTQVTIPEPVIDEEEKAEKAAAAKDTAVAAPAPKKKPKKKRKPRTKKEKKSRLNLLLAILIMVMILVFLLFVSLVI